MTTNLPAPDEPLQGSVLDASPDPVIVINTAVRRRKPIRPWYATNTYGLPAMYLAAVAALLLMAVVIPPAVQLPIAGMLAIILIYGPVGLVGFLILVQLPESFIANDIVMIAALLLSCAGNCVLLSRFGRFLDS